MIAFKNFTENNNGLEFTNLLNSKNISLNYKLLFLPQPLMRYVLIHELCHTIHMNHSSKFWQLVNKFEPNYKNLDPQLREAWKITPSWL
jgi:predicted metal-dependent hydrolase